MNNLKAKLNNYYVYRYLAHKIHKLRVLKNPRLEADRVYYPYFKKKINWNNPRNLIEKIFWLQLNSDTSLWTQCADKYRVRKYIQDCGFGDYLPKLYGKWDEADEIKYEDLPDNFVLKTNNGCGTVVVVKNKANLDIQSVNKSLKQWLRLPFGYRGMQLHYTRIKPCIIAEELLKGSLKDQKLSPRSLIDYKFYCINGEPQAIWVSYDRTKEGVYMNMYDLSWNNISNELVSSDYYTFKDQPIERPRCLEKMIEISRKLAEPFPQVRIDFYVINDEPVIGELTFTTGWGFFNIDFYEYLGNKMNLK